jgi:hypothetical protein
MMDAVEIELQIVERNQQEICDLGRVCLAEVLSMLQQSNAYSHV